MPIPGTAAGLSAVASRVGKDAQALEHERSGLLVETDAEWTAALERILGDPARGRRLGDAGRARIERDFSYDRIADLWSDFLRRIA